MSRAGAQKLVNVYPVQANNNNHKTISLLEKNIRCLLSMLLSTTQIIKDELPPPRKLRHFFAFQAFLNHSCMCNTVTLEHPGEHRVELRAR